MKWFSCYQNPSYLKRLQFRMVGYDVTCVIYVYLHGSRKQVHLSLVTGPPRSKWCVIVVLASTTALLRPAFFNHRWQAMEHLRFLDAQGMLSDE